MDIGVVAERINECSDPASSRLPPVRDKEGEGEKEREREREHVQRWLLEYGKILFLGLGEGTLEFTLLQVFFFTLPFLNKKYSSVIHSIPFLKGNQLNTS